MIIRKATIEDAEIISEHLFLAMEDILYEFIGIKNAVQAKRFLCHFVRRENNQYAYKNCFVAESQEGVKGSINIYDGAKLESLRSPIKQYIKQHFGINFNPEQETQKGEFYIDSFGVDPKSQGKGIGKKILQFVIDRADSHQQTLGLLVDVDNPKAEKLYLKFGFQLVGHKVFVGKQFKHLQRKPTKHI